MCSVLYSIPQVRDSASLYVFFLEIYNDRVNEGFSFLTDIEDLVIFNANIRSKLGKRSTYERKNG